MYLPLAYQGFVLRCTLRLGILLNDNKNVITLFIDVVNIIASRASDKTHAIDNSVVKIILDLIINLCNHYVTK